MERGSGLEMPGALGRTLIILGVCLLAATLAGSGCQKTTQAAQMPEKIVLPDATAALVAGLTGKSQWRKVDRSALAASLGWGQVSRGNTDGRLIALTFDAGADSASTPQVLDTLKAAGLQCTFFVTGQFAQQFPALVQRMSLDGHEVANHSFSHPRFTTLSPEQVDSQLSRTEDATRALTCSTTRPYFRFPYGAGSASLVKQLNAQGYMGVLWTFDTLDSVGASAQTVRERVNRYSCPGAIVLMHCGSIEGAKALPLVISDLKGAGYRLVTLTEVLQRPGNP